MPRITPPALSPSTATGTFATLTDVADVQADVDSLSASLADVAINWGVPGDIAPSPGYGAMGAAARSLTAGRIFLMRFVPTRARTITLAAFSNSAVGSSGDPVEIGIYSSGPTTLTRLATSGALTGKFTSLGGPKTVPISLAVDPTQVYYVAFVAATIAAGVPSVVGAAGLTNDQWTLFGATPPNAGAGFIDGALSGGLLPATITAASAAFPGVATHPLVALREA